MAEEPDVIRQEIEQTRSNLTEKLETLESLETGEGEGLAETPYRAYVELKQGRLPQAIARARRTPVLPALWPLLAAPDCHPKGCGLKGGPARY